LGLHILSRETIVDRPVEEVFGFFTTAANLGLVTPPSMGFRFREDPPGQLSAGAVVRYQVRLAGIRINWDTRITEWDPPHRFADIQEKGPYSRWTHVHTFDAIDDNHTVMRDRVVYSVPLGPLGEVARGLFVGAQLDSIFDYRQKAFLAALDGQPQPPGPGALKAMLVPAGAALVAAGLTVGLLLWRRRGSAGED
jgi:ligand-binding SRPBCC domain-containing protein